MAEASAPFEAEEWVSAEEAAAMLKVSVATVYVYVGRKGLRSRGIAGSRKREYLCADIKREVQRRQRAKSEIAPGSSVVQITPQGPYYRGRSAIDLAETGTLEDAAALLWGVKADAAFMPTVPQAPEGFQQMADILAGRSSVERATSLLQLLEVANPRAFDLSPLGMARTGADILRWLAAILFDCRGPSVKPIHEVVAEALDLDTSRTELVRRLLVLAADHGLEPASEAVRAVANTGVTPWRTVAAGLMVSAGRRSSSWHYQAVQTLLAEMMTAGDARAPIIRRLRQGDPVLGFDTPLYSGHDPRARALLASCEALLPDDSELQAFEAALAMMREMGDWEPDFPLVRAFVNRKLKVDASDPIFCLARSTGWISHTIDQFALNEQDAREGRARWASGANGPTPPIYGAKL